MGTDTRTAILDTAERLIQSHGSNGISYQTISDIVGIRKASIHYHFPTKEKLIEEVIRRYCRTFMDAVDGILDTDAPAPVKLRKYTALFERTLREGAGKKVCLCGMLGAELASLGRPAALLLRRFYRDNGRRLARILTEGRRDGTIHYQGDAQTVGMMVFSFLEGAMLISRADGGARQFRGVIDRLVRLIEH